MNKYLVIFIASVFVSYFSITHYLNTTLYAATVSPLEQSIHLQVNRDLDESLSRQTFNNLKFSKRRNSNLYITLLNEYALKSRENAVIATAAAEGLSSGEVENILFDQEVQPTRSEDTTQLSADDNSVRETYLFERQMFRDLTNLQINTLAFEMFTNGSRSDSGFDLLHDLDRIEQLLFANRSPSQFDGSINLDRSTAKSVTSRGFSPGVSTSSPVLEEFEQELGDDEQSTEVDEQQQEASSSEADLPPNSLACPIDSSLQDALNEFESNQEETGFDLMPQDQDDGEFDSGSSDLNSFAKQAGFSRPNLRSFEPTATRCAGVDSTVSNNHLVFCLRTETVRTKARSYFPDQDDCVACEIQRIAKIVDDIHSDSLIPQKITGNVAEPAVCKNYALSVFSMNINIIAAPARSDLDILPLVENLTTESIVNTIATPIDSPTDEESTRLAIQGSTNRAITAIGDARALAEEITRNDDQRRIVSITESTAIDTHNIFINQMSQRLGQFSQNFTMMFEQLTQINESFVRINQKEVCR